MAKFKIGDMVKYDPSNCGCEMCTLASKDDNIGRITHVREDEWGIEYDLKFPSGAQVEWIMEPQLELFIQEITMEDLTVTYELD